MAESPNIEEIQALMRANDLEGKEAVTEDPVMASGPIIGPYTMVDVPVTLTLKSGVFLVDQPGRWAYTVHGIFATGRWKGEDSEVMRDMMFPFGSIVQYEYDFQALAAFEAEADKNASNSD